MAEWLIAPVLKTGIVRNKELSRVRIPLSPLARRMDLFFLYFIGFARLSIIKGMARLSHLAEPKQKKTRLDRNELKRKEGRKKEYF